MILKAVGFQCDLKERSMVCFYTHGNSDRSFFMKCTDIRDFIRVS